MDRIVIYHGSDYIITKPIKGMSNIHNDYGLAFYFADDLEMSKECANKSTSSGFVNNYRLDARSLSVLDLASEKINVLIGLLFYFIIRNFL